MSAAKDLRRSDSGAVAIIFGLAVLPVVLLVGSALDYTRAARAHSSLQAGVDAAVIDALGSWSLNEDKARTQASTIVNSVTNSPIQLTTFQRDTNARTIKIAATQSVATSFLRIINIQTIQVATEASVIAPQQFIQIAMALDNSGSMTGTRMPALIAASKLLVDTVAPQSTEDKIEFSLVPFGQLVNVGPTYADANWMDKFGLASNHFDHLEGQLLFRKTRFEMFSSMKDESGKAISWGGCVEARLGGLDVTDDAPSIFQPNSLFVPSFAPDEPGPAWGGQPADQPPAATYVTKVANSYMDDDGGTCAASPAVKDLTLSTRQNRACKYAGKTAIQSKKSSASAGVPTGPNFQCTTPPLTRLTPDVAKVKAALDLMQPVGGTNIPEGMAWAWRTLSRNAPFADGMPANTRNGRRIIVLMTDGENWVDQIANLNGSMYSAYGFFNDGRLTGGSGSNVGLVPMDKKLRDICKNVKDQSIEIFAVGLSIPSDSAKKLLTDCASPGRAYMVTDASELRTVFSNIGNTIKQPYITH